MSIVREFMALAGVGLAVAGVAMVHVPSAFIVAGVFLVLVAVRSVPALPPRKASPEEPES